MITDADLDLHSADDKPTVLAWELADRLDQRARKRGFDDGYDYGLRGISELIFKVSQNHPGRSEDTARQLHAMADYVRSNLK